MHIIATEVAKKLNWRLLNHIITRKSFTDKPLKYNKMPIIYLLLSNKMIIHIIGQYSYIVSFIK